MNKILFGFFIGLISLSCSKQKEEKLEPYIISKSDREYKAEIEKDKSQRPIKPVYHENQLIIDKQGNFFYYQQEDKSYRWNCVTESKNDTLPYLIDLQPEDIIKLPQENLDAFINENVLEKPKRRRILIMASQADTIKNIAFLKFLKTIKIPTYIIRRTTQEEDTVLEYKKNNRIYFSGRIQWDNSKLREEIRFVKPKNIENSLSPK